MMAVRLVRTLRKRLPVALAEYLAGDLRTVRGRDFHHLNLRWWKSVWPWQKIAEDRLQMAVDHPSARLKRRVRLGPFDAAPGKRVGQRAGTHARPPTSSLDAAASTLVAFSAPVGSSSCLK